MSTEILFASTNPFKIERFQNYLKPLEINVVGLNFKLDVVEDGKTPEENATKKALAGFKATGVPTIGVDYWLNIKGFPEDKQPGPFVRRIFIGNDGERLEATDDEMLTYYIDELNKIGGRAKGIWTSAITLVISPDKVYSATFTRKTIFTSKRTDKVTPGEPLNSIQKEPESCKYLSLLTPDEWRDIQTQDTIGYINFIKSHREEIDARLKVIEESKQVQTPEQGIPQARQL